MNKTHKTLIAIAFTLPFAGAALAGSGPDATKARIIDKGEVRQQAPAPNYTPNNAPNPVQSQPTMPQPQASQHNGNQEGVYNGVRGNLSTDRGSGPEHRKTKIISAQEANEEAARRNAQPQQR